MVCTKKNCSGRMDILGSKMAHPCNSGLALKTFSEFRRMKGANRSMKILLACFSGKNFNWGNLIFLAHFVLLDWA